MRARGRWTRAAIGAQSLFASLLALGAAVLAVDVADWRYWRVDLSASGRNTLDPAVLDVIERLPEPVVVDVFFRALLGPYEGVSREVQNRQLELLAVAANSRRDKLEVRTHAPANFEEARERQKELGVEGENLIVLSCGARRAELTLFGDVAVVDWGNPTEDGVRYLTSQGIAGVVDLRTWSSDSRAFRPPGLSEFRGEEAFAQALLKVASGQAPRVYFAKGQGEPDLRGAQPTDLSHLCSALERDGFAVGEWDPVRTPALPADCEVLALIGARQPFQPAAARAVEEYVRGGGRALLAPDLSELEQANEGGIVSLLRALGIVARPGVVCQPVVGQTGEKLEGLGYCANLLIDESGMSASSKLTEPLRRRGRRIQFRLSASFEGPIQTGTERPALPLISSPRDSWRDLPDQNGRYDYTCNPSRGETRSRYALVSAKEFRPEQPRAGDTVKEGRVLAVASAYFFENLDFALNRDFALLAFNWMAERDYQLTVSPLRRGERFLDLERGSAKPILTLTLWLGLPGLCALVGVWVWLRRRS